MSDMTLINGDCFEDFVKWIEKVSLKLKEVLKPEGSFYIFGDDKNIAYIQVALDKHFKLINNLVWYKEDYHLKNMKDFRSYAPMSERILFYSNGVSATGLKEIQNNQELYKSIRDYFTNERKKTTLTYKEINLQCFNTAANGGGMASNILTAYKDGWTFPTKEKYEKLQSIGICKKPYEDLRLEYEDLRLEYEKQRRTFNYQIGIHEIISSNIIKANENTAHPTTKPTAILETLIKASTNEDDIVIDCFMGSGSTGLACKNLNRKFIGIELDEEYFKIAKDRINEKNN